MTIIATATTPYCRTNGSISPIKCSISVIYEAVQQDVQESLHARIGEAQRRRALVIHGDRSLHILEGGFADEAVVTDALDVEQPSVGRKADLAQGNIYPQGCTRASRSTAGENAQPIDPGTDHWGAGRITYDLRRLRLHGLTERIPKTHRYRITPKGLRTAILYTGLYNRSLRTGLAVISAAEYDCVIVPKFQPATLGKILL